MTLEAVVHAIHVAFPVRPRPGAREITKEGDDHFERLDMRRRLTQPQLATIVMFLEYWATNGSDIGPNDEAATARDALANYWRDRLAAA